MVRQESLVKKRVRLVLEQQCADLGRELLARVPAGVGFTLTLSDVGGRGSLAYVSTISRESTTAMLRDMADHIEAKR